MRQSILNGRFLRENIHWLILVFLELFTLAECRQCYSCMSKYYEKAWPYLGYNRIYKTPAVFSDSCAQPSGRGAMSKVPSQPCTGISSCITIKEKIESGAGNVFFIRGCFSDIFLYGFNKSPEVQKLNYKDQYCREFNSTSLTSASARAAHSKMYVCSCTTDRCNDEAHPNTATHPDYQATYVIGTLLLIAQYIRQLC